MNIIVTALGGRGRFRASVDGRTLCETSTPFLSGARVLLREGVPPETVLTMTHEGDPTVALRSTVGTAAGLVVRECERSGPRFRPYRAFASDVPALV